MAQKLPPVDPGLTAPARGTLAQPTPRFDRLAREWEDDGWDHLEETPHRREVSEERARSVISWNTSPDLGFDRALNPYRGCEHGCIYCYARLTHAWLGLSPGHDYETRLIARPDAAKVLEKEIAKPGYRVAPLALGSNTDPSRKLSGPMATGAPLVAMIQGSGWAPSILRSESGQGRPSSLAAAR